jgi:hypothetical protein
MTRGREARVVGAVFVSAAAYILVASGAMRRARLAAPVISE